MAVNFGQVRQVLFSVAEVGGDGEHYYTTYVSQLSNLLVETRPGRTFQTALRGIIDYAEQRMYRELDLLVTRDVDNTTFLSSGNRHVTLSVCYWHLCPWLEQISVITPVTAGTFNGRVSSYAPSPRIYWISHGRISTNTGFRFTLRAWMAHLCHRPAPDARLSAGIHRHQRPAPLSASNSSTF